MFTWKILRGLFDIRRKVGYFTDPSYRGSLLARKGDHCSVYYFQTRWAFLVPSRVGAQAVCASGGIITFPAIVPSLATPRTPFLALAGACVIVRVVVLTLLDSRTLLEGAGGC